MAQRRSGPVELGVKRDLRRLPEDDRRSALAASALAIAQLLDGVAVPVVLCADCGGGAASGVGVDKQLSSAAQAARELRGTMGELMKNAPTARGGIDDLRARRAARAASG